MVSYCQGGPTIPDNLITLCSRWHRHLHGGLIVLGADKIWRDQHGRELGTGQIPKLWEAPSFEIELVGLLLGPEMETIHSGTAAAVG